MSEKDTEVLEPTDDGSGTQSFLEEDKEFLREFITEWLDHLQHSEAALLSLEENPKDMASLDAIFRAFHSIKGAAGFLGLDKLQRMAHLAENLLDRARRYEIEMTGGYADLALSCGDAVRAFIAELQATGGRVRKLPENYDALIARLEAPEESVAQIATAPVASEDLLARPAAEMPDTVRVRTDRLDGLINTIGELVVTQSMITENAVVAGGADPALTQSAALLGKITRELQTVSMSMRMVPLRTTFQKMARLIRDLSRRSGKAVEFVVEGEDTEIDRNVVESLSDPLVHMIRNSMDHGIEDGPERVAAGKSAQGRLHLRASHADGNVVLELHDDGRGLDRDKILARAIERGVVDSGRELTDADVYRLIFSSGFTTADKVTDISGRGVGMDVVRRNVEAVRGRIELDSRRGEGTRVTLRIPLTLAIIDGLLVRVGSEDYIVPTLSVHHAFRPEPSVLSTVHGRGEMVSWRGGFVPVYRLHRLFGIHDAVERPEKGLLLLVEHAGEQFALLADRLLGKHQVVVKSLKQGLGDVPGVSGAAILGNGRVGLILDLGSISRLARSAEAAAA